ncbi:hypothetical protein ACOME3_007058 [Neoechinorhynchus agilis]
MCRANGVKFISAQTFGLSGRIFVDLGPSFTVYDSDGLPPVQCIVNAIHTNGHVHIFDEQRHGYDVGDHVRFTEVRGLTKLNNQEFKIVEVISSSCFSIGDLTYLGEEYESGGLVVNVKQPVTLSFRDLETEISKPTCVEYDFAKIDYPHHLHLAYEALKMFKQNLDRLPFAYNEEDANIFLKYVEEKNFELKLIEEINEKLIKRFAFTCAGDLCPMVSFIGGVAAQEVIKACTGKFMPIKQFLYFEYFEVIDAIEHLKVCADEKDDATLDRRYSRQVHVIGKELQMRLLDAKIFIVGAGALGCELLKNFAMMGVSSGSNGLTYITDMDIIERSNLNRQFLFRTEDIGKDSEQIYDDEFFQSLDLVCNALDNVASRVYMDLRCVFYRKPLLESGTLGTAASTQVVVPFLTESYSTSQDPAEKSFPICTLRNFPNTIEHTLHWAREQFEGLFTNNVRIAMEFVEDKSSYLKKSLKGNSGVVVSELEQIRATLVNDRPKDIYDCVRWARQQFEHLFCNQIKQLLHNFPADAVTSAGMPFWSGPKRCPHSFPYDRSNETHAQFVWSAANLFADVYGLEQNRDMSAILDMADKCEIDEFKPQSGVKIAVTDNEIEQAPSVQVDNIEQMVDTVFEEVRHSNVALYPLEFEKDSDSNLHMDFITSCSNLRAENYDIEPADKIQSKLIAGRIIPAIATTTSMIVGLVCLELLKILARNDLKEDKIELYRNAYINLATSHFAFCEPFPPPKRKMKPNNAGDKRTFTLWDRIDVQGDMTLAEFIEYFERNHNIKISMISHGVSMIYSFFLDKAKTKKRLGMFVSDVIKEIQGSEYNDRAKSFVLELYATDVVDDDDIEIPYVNLILAGRKDMVADL